MVGHGQFMQALRWWIESQPAKLTGEHLRAFRQLDRSAPILNCQGYVLARAGLNGPYGARWLIRERS